MNKAITGLLVGVGLLIAVKGLPKGRVKIGRPSQVNPNIFSRFFDISEVTESSNAEAAGISNNAPASAIENARNVAQLVLDPLAEFVAPNQIVITSWFRNDAVNDLAGGEPDSPHLDGRAVDVQCFTPAGENVTYLLVRGLYDLGLPFRKCILYNSSTNPTRLHIEYLAGGNIRQYLLKGSDGYSILNNTFIASEFL